MAHVELWISLSWRHGSLPGSDRRRRNDDERKAEERNGSPIVFFLPHPLRMAPAGRGQWRALNIFFQPPSRSGGSPVYDAVRAAQLSMDDAAPAQRGHYRPLGRHLSQPNPPRARAIHACGHQRPKLCDMVCMCCCSAHGCRRPRVASAVTRTRPVPCASRCERTADGPFESGGGGVA